MSNVTPFTIRAVLRTNKPNAKGLCPVSVCVTVKGKRAYVSTGIRVHPDHWKDGRVRTHPNAALYNAQIARRLNDAEAELLKVQAADIKDALQAVLGDDGKGSFMDYASEVLMRLPVAESTRRRWGIGLDHIKSYAPDLRWSQITPAWLTKFNTYLCGRMLQNSARPIFVLIRIVFNRALADGTTRLYPFKDWKFPKSKASVRQYLTLEETEKIRNLLFSRPDFPVALRTTMAHFLLECYSGIRHSDWGKWQTEKLTDGESLHLVTTKTGEPIYLPLKDSPRLSEIVSYIRDNGLTYTYTNQDANRQLKEVARHTGIKKHLTTHVARHTCATLLLDRSFSRETVAEVLGVSIRIIDTYAKMTRQKVRMEYERIGGL